MSMINFVSLKCCLEIKGVIKDFFGWGKTWTQMKLMLKEAFCTRFSPFCQMQFKSTSLLFLSLFDPSVYRQLYPNGLQCCALHCLQKWEWKPSAVSGGCFSSLTCPYPRQLHVPGFGVAEAGSPYIWVTVVHMCWGPGLGSVSEAGFLPEKKTL